MPMPNNFKGKSDELKPREQLMRSASVADVADDTLLAILSSAPFDPVVIFREAVRWSARSIMVAHTHPSGDPNPSKGDVEATRQLKDAAKLLGVNFLDHLIIDSPDSANGLGFVSMAELMAE